ncbi:unnamed protein product [Urochloa decumbens]|uniref:Uncharacterized protein n=1 Tax=Urochloa decumbens TaxID=240449 RepID=A0ABC9AQE5_9POAL
MAAAGGSDDKLALVRQVEKTLDKADVSVQALRWHGRSIYRVPAHIKDLNPKAYKPQVVSLGPFHHGDPKLVPMEEHKRRALQRLLQRAKRPLQEFVAGVEEVAEQLESVYLDLGSEWCGVVGRMRFLEMMIVDGCFLLEVMRAARNTGDDYAPDDPVFSHHGVLCMVPYIRRDMLMLENQVPLLLLQKLVAAETGKPPKDDVINMMVLRFMSSLSWLPVTGSTLGLHPLDVLRRSMLYGPYQASQQDEKGHVPETNIIRSAVELRQAGIRFKKSDSDSLQNLRFWHGVLNIPAVSVDDSTEYMFLNMMAFERLHAGTGKDVTAFVFFMDNIIKSAKDVALLRRSGIIQNAVGSDEAVAKLFASMSKDIVLKPEGALNAVHRAANAYCNKRWNKWRANIFHNYFRSPTSLLNFLAAVIALVMIITRTAYTIMCYYQLKAAD